MALRILSIPIVLPFLICMYLINFGQTNEIIEADQRTFSVDYENNQFLKDGNPFRFVAGEFHYFRVLPGTWRDKLRTMRAAGLNAVTTYVEWSLHNPKDGVYTWDGIANLEQFIQIAESEGLLVILRPGPYICAERDMGGFPYWLLNKYPQILLRTLDTNYVVEVEKWYSVLMPKMTPYFYGNGGPIIMVQVENEYGSFDCNPKYRLWGKNVTERYVEQKAVLFTNDGPSQLPCGKIPGVLATLDFAPATNYDQIIRQFRRYQPKGPFVCAEFYPGWLTHWQELKSARIATNQVVDGLRALLNTNASVNIYMFFGGTNFGFTAGANNGGRGAFEPDLTSYDYDAPMDEAGDPTFKFYELRKAIGTYLPLPDIPMPTPQPKIKFNYTIPMTAKQMLFSARARELIGSIPVNNYDLMSFEALNQYSGFILYETILPKFKQDPCLLTVNGLRDRAHVYLNNKQMGTLSRENLLNTVSLTAGVGNKLQILVENQGRINYGIMNDFKGILGNVTFTTENIALHNWTMTGFSFENYESIKTLLSSTNHRIDFPEKDNYLLKTAPLLFEGSLEIPTNQPIFDTYFDPSGWGKGILFINGFNLGRYWPVAGPQITLYVPKEILKHGTNDIVMLELQKSSTCGIRFLDKPNLDG